MKPSPSDDIVYGSLRKTCSATTIETHCRGCRILEGNRYLVVVENMCDGPWIYSARESSMPIVEELRRDVPGPDLWFIPVRRSAEVMPAE